MVSVKQRVTLASALTVGLVTAILAVSAIVMGGGVSVPESTLDALEVKTYGQALAEQVNAGDGAGIDGTFRNSGVAIDPEANAYYAVNGVHPVRRGDYSSYYPKSIVKASLAGDSIIEVYSFSEVNGRDVDMEALTFAADRSKLYVGDEYNFIYELDLESGEITKEWDLADIGVETAVDKGIEALAYSAATEYFYAGIQGTGEILTLEITEKGISKIDSFSLEAGWAPSGLFAHEDGHLYIVSMRGGGTAGNQMIFKYDMEGTLTSKIVIPTSLGLTRPDGIAFSEDGAYVFIVDSQGPLYEGHSLYRIRWKDPGSV